MTPDQSGLNVGVIIVTHDRGKFMASNIDCLLRQTRLSAHLVIVDRGSRSHRSVQAAGRQCLRP
jgi:GT2 family glycosyltransferase